MAREHETSSRENDDGSTHHTKHSHEPAESHDDSPDVRRSYDRGADGEKSNDHVTDQQTGNTYYVSDTDDGNHREGDVTNDRGNDVSRPGLTEHLNGDS